MHINIIDIIYFLSAAFMVFILFIGINAVFAILIGILIFFGWLQLKKYNEINFEGEQTK